MNKIIYLENNDSKVAIENGEVISFIVNEKEYIHQKGNKGWRKSDDEMFPVIGPTSKNNYRVHTKNGDAILDQHGLLRELKYNLVSSSTTKATFQKEYLANTSIKNSKFPKKSTEKKLFWPYDFTFQKIISLQDNILTIDFIINSVKEMPFMLGYHPAFLLSNTGKETLTFINKNTTLKEIKKVGDKAFPVLNSSSITLHNVNKNAIKITTKGFSNFMLWTQVNNMLCIEPITHYPSYKDEKYSEQNMLLSKGKNTFSVQIKIVS